MLNVTDLKNGTYFQEDGVPFEVLKYEHIKMGRGTANVKIKVKNILTGAIVMKGYISNHRVEEAELNAQKGEFQYRTASDFIFDVEDEDDTVEISKDTVGFIGKFLKKGMAVKILSFDGQYISVEIPIKVSFRVKEAPPDARGNSSTASYKEVIIDTNAIVKAPMFIKEGDEIVVDTRTGEYVSRA